MANEPDPSGDAATEGSTPETPAARYRRLQAERRAGPTQLLETKPEYGQDTLWRGLARGGQARLLVVRATGAVREATSRLGCSTDVSQLAGEFIVATMLIRSTLNPEERMQVQLNHNGPLGQLIVDAWDDGGVRCYIRSPQVELTDHPYLIGDGTLQVARSSPRRRTGHQSTVTLQADVESSMMHYLLESEQILSLLRMDVHVHEGEVVRAVGYLLQMMPEGTRDDLKQLLLNVEKLAPLGSAMRVGDPDAIAWAEQLMQGMPWDQVAREDVLFSCRCSHERILNMLATLPRADIEDLSKGDEPLEMTCDYCRTKYQMSPAEVAVLLEEPS